MELDVRLIVPAPDADAILLDDDGALPARSTRLGDGEAAIVPVSAMLRDHWSGPAPIIETHPRWEGVPDAEPIPTLVLTEPARAGWDPPSGLAFGPIPTTL